MIQVKQERRLYLSYCIVALIIKYVKYADCLLGNFTLDGVAEKFIDGHWNSFQPW